MEFGKNVLSDQEGKLKVQVSHLLGLYDKCGHSCSPGFILFLVSVSMSLRARRFLLLNLTGPGAAPSNGTSNRSILHLHWPVLRPLAIRGYSALKVWLM